MVENSYAHANDTLTGTRNVVEGIDARRPWDTKATGAKHLALGIYTDFQVRPAATSGVVVLVRAGEL